MNETSERMLSRSYTQTKLTEERSKQMKQQNHRPQLLVTAENGKGKTDTRRGKTFCLLQLADKIELKRKTQTLE